MYHCNFAPWHADDPITTDREDDDEEEMMTEFADTYSAYDDDETSYDDDDDDERSYFGGLVEDEHGDLVEPFPDTVYNRRFGYDTNPMIARQFHVEDPDQDVRRPQRRAMRQEMRAGFRHADVERASAMRLLGAPDVLSMNGFAPIDRRFDHERRDREDFVDESRRLRDPFLGPEPKRGDIRHEKVPRSGLRGRAQNPRPKISLAEERVTERAGAAYRPNGVGRTVEARESERSKRREIATDAYGTSWHDHRRRADGPRLDRFAPTRRQQEDLGFDRYDGNRALEERRGGETTSIAPVHRGNAVRSSRAGASRRYDHDGARVGGAVVPSRRLMGTSATAYRRGADVDGRGDYGRSEIAEIARRADDRRVDRHDRGGRVMETVGATRAVVERDPLKSDSATNRAYVSGRRVEEVGSVATSGVRETTSLKRDRAAPEPSRRREELRAHTQRGTVAPNRRAKISDRVAPTRTIFEAAAERGQLHDPRGSAHVPGRVGGSRFANSSAPAQRMQHETPRVKGGVRKRTHFELGVNDSGTRVDATREIVSSTRGLRPTSRINAGQRDSHARVGDVRERRNHTVHVRSRALPGIVDAPPRRLPSERRQKMSLA